MYDVRHILSRPVTVALAAAVLVFAWQALTVHYNYGGNWTALFCTGEKLRTPPELDHEGIYRFKGSTGYDGQFYHYMAHDPFLKRGFAAYLDADRLRYRRILIPAAAYLLAAGQDRFVDTALFGVIWFSVVLGAFWLSRYAAFNGWHAAWGLAFLLVPATIVAVDRTIVDATLAALTVGLVYYAREGPSWKVYLVLVCAVLNRETGVLLVAGYCLYLLSSRLWRKALLFATSTIPALVWLCYATPRTVGDITSGALNTGPPRPGRFLVFRILRAAKYDLPDHLARVMTALDYMLAAGVILGMLLSLVFLWKRPRSAEAFLALAFTGLMIPVANFVGLQDPFTHARLASPLLLLVAMLGMRHGWRLAFLPLGLVTLRTAAQLGPQALGVFRGLVGGG